MYLDLQFLYIKMKRKTLYLIKPTTVILALGTYRKTLQACLKILPHEIEFITMIYNEASMFLQNYLSIKHFPHSFFSPIEQPNPKEITFSKWKVAPSFSFNETNEVNSVSIQESKLVT